MPDQSPWGDILPPMPTEFQMPFWYLSLQSFWLFYPADPVVVASLLPDLPAGEGVKVARFDGLDGRALVSLDFQAYTSSWSSGLELTREIEFNAYVYPEVREPDVPLMPWQQYVRGSDQTKSIGGWRLHVPCDNPVAVQAGTELFGEPKFLAQFTYTTPSLNSPDVVTWSYAVYDQQDPSPSPPPGDKLIAQVDADLRGVPSVPVNGSPLIEYGAVSYRGATRLVGNVWNFYGAFDTYFLDDTSARNVRLRLGTGADKHRLWEDLSTLIGSTPPIAAQTFQSPPVSAEDRPFLPTPAR